MTGRHDKSSHHHSYLHAFGAGVGLHSSTLELGLKDLLFAGRHVAEQRHALLL